MASLPFQGNAWALSNAGLAAAASELGVHAPEIWTVLAVESSGCGYLRDRRPQIRFERHVFHRLTHGQYDDGDISDPIPGGYGPTGAPQHDRLTTALTKNRAAALQSASWGIGQIMGENHSLAGFQGVEQMVAAMSESEDEQLAAMAGFLTGTGLASSLRSHDWTSFARGYNGPHYAINRYDIRLNSEFQKYSVGVLPDLNVRASQLYLTYLGFHPGRIDGIPGVQTLSELAQFQAQQGIPRDTTIDADTVAELLAVLAQTSASTR
jgi:hypothetical protein